MWDAEKDDDASFERRLDSVVREIGDRGKVQVSEAVPPTAAAVSRTLAPTRAPAPTPAPTQTPTPAPVPAPIPALRVASALAPAPAPAPMAASFTTQGPQPSLSPSLALTAATPPQSQPQPAVSVTTSSSFAEMVSFMREEREQAKTERAEMEATLESKLAEQKAQMDAKLQQVEEQKQVMVATVEMQRQQAELQRVRELASAMSCVSQGQLELLQTRLDALHQAKLLTDDEIGALEDCMTDYIDCRSSLDPAAAEIDVAAEKVKKMVGLSEAVGKDGMLARQLRRKFVL